MIGSIAEVRGALDTLAAQVGACDRHELRGATTDSLQAVLHCAKGPVEIGFAVEPAPPHRISSLRFE